MSLHQAWRRIRRPVIATLVALHFIIGWLCFVQRPSVVLEVPPLRAVIARYRELGFAQTWRMFAPPARSHYRIGYALRFDGGWSDLLYLHDVAADRARDHFFLPRGQIRLGNQLRHPNLREFNLDDEPFFRHYFQQLAAFYCFGDGAIPELRAVRFYSVVIPIEPFFDDEDDPTNPSMEPTVTGLYQRECSER
jgi:hypothetical protein